MLGESELSNRTVSVIMLTLLLTGILAFNVREALAQSETSLYVDPLTTSVAVNGEFSVNVTVADVSNLFGYQFYLGYNTTLLYFLGIVVFPPFEHSFRVNETEGYVYVEGSLPVGHPPVSGSAPLASITFMTASPGSCTLHLYDTILFDPASNPIAHTTIDGTVLVTEGVHDIAITEATPLKTTVGQGYMMNIKVVADNQGDYVETVNVTVYANTSSVASQNITLANGGNATIVASWDTTGFVKGNYTIWAYAWPVPGETDTADNTFTGGTVRVGMPGDIMPPIGVVDMTDIGWIALAYGSKAGDLRWNANADVNNDGTVDMTDIGYAALSYGKQDP